MCNFFLSYIHDAFNTKLRRSTDCFVWLLLRRICVVDFLFCTTEEKTSRASSILPFMCRAWLFTVLMLMDFNSSTFTVSAVMYQNTCLWYCYKNGNDVIKIINKSFKNKNNGLFTWLTNKQKYTSNNNACIKKVNGQRNNQAITKCSIKSD